MQLKLSNYNKPSSKRWKFISKFLCRTLPIYAGIIAGLPDKLIAGDNKAYIIAALSLIVATISGLSEFTSDVK